MKDFIRKITSRKFIVALIGIIVGIAAVFGIDESEYAAIAGMVTALGSIVSYIIGEAKIDAASAAQPDINIFDNSPYEEEDEEDVPEIEN